MRSGAAAAAAFSIAFIAHAQPADSGPRVGDSYEIRLHHESVMQSSDGSSGNSGGGHAYVERVVAVRDDGLELEYDLPPEVSARDRDPIWQFPARVFRPSSGPIQLLNRSELEARLERWLTTASIPRTACGTWYFTWNAFQIECDPQAVVQTIETLDLQRNELRDGAPYRDPAAREAGRLRETSAGVDGATFVAEMPLDPQIVRNRRVESDLVVAAVMRTTLTREDAVRARATEEISGMITVTLEADPTGQVRRRVRVTRVETRESSGRTETETQTETTDRRVISPPRT